jgi:hypothetical protein
MVILNLNILFAREKTTKIHKMEHKRKRKTTRVMGRRSKRRLIPKKRNKRKRRTQISRAKILC